MKKDDISMEVYETVSPYANMMKALEKYLAELVDKELGIATIEFVDELPEEGKENHLYIVTGDGTARIWKDGWVELDEVIATIKVNGDTQAIVDRTVDIFVPTKVSELENDSKYVDEDDLGDVERAAQEAQESADDAQASADKAQETADKAQESADGAQASADKAQETADGAQAAADKAQESADDAQAAADKAQETADKALEDIPTKVSQLENDSDYATKDETIGGIQVNGVDQEVVERIVNIFVPTKTSEIENDSDYTTNAIMKEEIADQIAEIVAGAPESLDTLKEIADWIEGHAEDAAEMNSEIKANAEDIAALQELIGELPSSASSIVEYIEEAAAAAQTTADNAASAAASAQTAADEAQATADKALEDIPTKVSQLENDSKYVDEDALAEVSTAAQNAQTAADSAAEAAKEAKDAIPEKVSELENDAGYITEEDLPTKVSELENDANYVDEDALDTVAKAAINGITLNGDEVEVKDNVAAIEFDDVSNGSDGIKTLTVEGDLFEFVNETCSAIGVYFMRATSSITSTPESAAFYIMLLRNSTAQAAMLAFRAGSNQNIYQCKEQSSEWGDWNLIIPAKPTYDSGTVIF